MLQNYKIIIIKIYSGSITNILKYNEWNTIHTYILFQLKALGPIDLLVGGSPCNDFALVNHQRKGLEGIHKY